MNLKNVVIINDFDYIQGGASKVAIDTANILVNSNKNLNVYFFSACHSNSSNLDKKVVNVCTNQNEPLNDKNKIRGILNGLYNYKAKKKLKKLLLSLNRNETIVHIHGWTKALSASIFDVVFKLKFKIVLTMHDYFTACPNGGYFNYKKDEICSLNPMCWKCIMCDCDSRNYIFKIYRVIRQFIQNRVIRLNDRLTDVISISDFSERILKNTLNPKIIIHRVNNPIEIDENLKKVDYKKNKYFLYVGRVSKEKGIDVFCKAISDTYKSGIVVGDGPELSELKKKFPNIKYVGWKSNNEVKEYMKGARALIFPSKWYEVAPLTPLEAFQYGIPCIASKNSAASDYINNDNGMIYDNYEGLIDILNYRFDKASFNVKTDMNNDYYSNLVNTYLKIMR